MLENFTTLVVSGMEIPAGVTTPEGAAKAAVLLIPGSLFSDVDGNYPTWNMSPHAYKDLAHQLAALGIATLRFAKVGPVRVAKSWTPTPGHASRRRSSSGC